MKRAMPSRLLAAAFVSWLSVVGVSRAKAQEVKPPAVGPAHPPEGAVVYPPNDLRPDVSVLALLPSSMKNLIAIRAVLVGNDVDRRCQMIVVPGGQSRVSETAVFLRRTGEKASIVTIVARRPAVDILASAQKRAGPAGDWKKHLAPGDMETVEVPVDTDLADKLEQVWELMLDRVREPPDQASAFDASMYYFTHAESEHGHRSGRMEGGDQEWPSRQLVVHPTLAGHLHTVGWAMVEFARSNATDRPKVKAALDELAGKLLERLIVLGHKPPPVKLRRSWDLARQEQPTPHPK
jgi:hypothetical protein